MVGFRYLNPTYQAAMLLLGRCEFGWCWWGLCVRRREQPGDGSW